MEQLVKAMLAIGARLPEIQYRCLIFEFLPVFGHSFPITLHVHLLDMRSKLAQSLTIGQNCSCAKVLNYPENTIKFSFQMKKLLWIVVL